MAGADEFDGSVVRGASDDQRRELPSHRALGKNAIRHTDHSSSGSSASARLRNVACRWLISIDAAMPLPETSPSRKTRPDFRLKHVAIIAADDARRGVVISHVPSLRREVARRQQRLLNPRGEQQIAFECAALFGRQMIETELLQRICQQAIGFDRVVTCFAETVRSGVHSIQRCIDFAEQIRQRGIGAWCLYCRLEPVVSSFQFRAQIGLLWACHRLILLEFPMLRLAFPSGFSRQTLKVCRRLSAGFRDGDTNARIRRSARGERRLSLQQGKPRGALPLRLHPMPQASRRDSGVFPRFGRTLAPHKSTGRRPEAAAPLPMPGK